jgi:hypothetical protein
MNDIYDNEGLDWDGLDGDPMEDYPLDMENESIVAPEENAETEAMAEDARFLHSSNEDEYLTCVRMAARGNQYSGEVVEGCSGPILVEKYKRLVNDTIVKFRVPVDQHGYVARQFLTGKIANLVLHLATRSPGKVLLKENVFHIVDASVKESTQKLISFGEKYLRAAALQIELTEVLGDINKLSQIGENGKKGIPLPVSAPKPRRAPAPSPRDKFNPRVGNGVAKATAAAAASRDPFQYLGRGHLSAYPTDRCRLLWVRNWDRAKMDKLRKSGCCLICEQKGHIVKNCTLRDVLFARGKFCFRPEWK